MRETKTIAIASRDRVIPVALTSLVLLVVVLITSISGAAAPV